MNNLDGKTMRVTFPEKKTQLFLTYTLFLPSTRGQTQGLAQGREVLYH